MKLKNQLKTKNLIITALNPEEMEMFCNEPSLLSEKLGITIDEKRDEHLQAAYSQMNESTKASGINYYWNSLWIIVPKNSNKMAGTIAFFGKPDEHSEVEIGYGIIENFRMKGYATEALKALADFAFSKEAYYIVAKTEPDNAGSIRVLNKAGFTLKSENEDELYFELEKPESNWLSIYMCLGLSIGMAIGSSSDNMAIGMSIGLALGTALGIYLDSNDKKKRKGNNDKSS